MATTTVNINTALKINVTPIESGTAGRVLFQNSANQISQSSELFWDNTNSRLSIGQGSSPSARLDIRAQGVLSTDVALRVRNSTNTTNLLDLAGNGDATFRTSYTSSILMSKDLNSAPIISSFTAGKLSSSIRTDYNTTDLYYGSVYLYDWNQVLRATIRAMGTSFLNGRSAKLVIGGTDLTSDGSSNILGIFNGNVPSSSTSDAFCMYSADITAGNAAPHFRTENGSIIKLFRGASLTSSDGTLGNAVTRIAELEARLQAHGLIA